MPQNKAAKSIFLQQSGPLGLDIGNYSIKIALVRKSPFSKKKNLSFNVVALPNDTSPQAIIQAIQQAVKDLSVDSRKVNLALSGSSVVVRYIVLPQMKEADVSKSLEFELDKYIPYKKEDAIINYHILTKVPDNRMIVLLVAAERKIIQETLALVKEAGLEPQLITVEPLAYGELFKAVMPHYKGMAALLDVGYRLSKLVALENGMPFFSRDIEIGEYDIMQMISEKLGISFAAAKELAYAPAQKKDEVSQAAKTELHSLLNELSLSFEYCQRNLEKTVTLLYVCGGGAKINLLTEFLREKMPEVKVSVLDITQGFKISPAKALVSSNQYQPLLGLSAGLALS